MLIEYNHKQCNIKSCSNKQSKNLLCSYHNNIYIKSAKIENKIQRLEKLVIGEANLKDKLVYYRNFFIHYTTGIHVPYIEHFPMETLFLYYLPKIHRDELPDNSFTIEQFISNFDYPENSYLDNIKVKENTTQFKVPFIAFASSKEKYNKAVWFGILWLFFFMVYTFLNSMIEFIPYKQYWTGIILILLNCFTVLITGIYFINSSKILIADAISNNLLNTPAKNREFLKNSHPFIEKIRTMEENLWFFYGILTAAIGRLIYDGYKNIQSGSSKEYTIYFAYSIIATILVFLIIKTIWNNRHLLKIVRRIPTDSLRFDLYEKNRNIGLSSVMSFYRSMAAYNLTVIVAYIFSIMYTRSVNIEMGFAPILIVSFFFAWNFSSPFILAFNFHKIKKAFQLKRLNEMKRLQNLTSASSIIKYDFLENLKLKFLPPIKILKTILTVTLYLTPIIMSYLIPKYQYYLDNKIVEIIDIIKNLC